MGLINQPSGSIKLTNVSLVRMKKGKKRFEIACYKNKVQDWRKGVEKDLDEVLQIHQVFLNVSKGLVASNEELKTAFNTTDQDEIIAQILKKGELQVGSKEREAQANEIHAQVIELISNKCINPNNKRPYPPTIIDKTLKELQVNIVTSKPAKTQALDAIRLLVQKQIIPIARAHMKVRCVVTLPAKEVKKLKLPEKVKAVVDSVDSEEIETDQWELVAFIDPGSFRKIDQLLQDETKGQSSVDVLDLAVVEQGDQEL